MPYLGKTPSQATRQRYYKTASGGETSISGTMTTGGTLTFNDGEFVDVKLNGVSLVAGTDYNTSTANTIAGLSALAANDQVEIVVYDTFSVFSGNVDSNLSVGGTASIAGHASIGVDAVDASRALTVAGSTDDSSASALVVYNSSLASQFAVRNDGLITTAGSVGIATTTPTLDSALAGLSVNSGSTLLHINDTDGACLKLSDPASGSNRGLGIALQGTSAVISNCESGELRFGTGNTERMRINSNGDVQLGTITNHGDDNQGGVTFQASTFDRMMVNIGHTDGSSRPVVRFFGNASESSVGNISCNGSSTAYNTSSDHRLKESVVDMTGAIDRVKALAPKRFNFIADADTTVDGFLAHEAQAVVPEAVTGSHNEVDEDGNAVMQSIDQSKLVPLLTGALQEAIAKIETLETKVAALEAGE